MKGHAVMDPHEAYFRSLASDESNLLVLREILYEGSWDEMVADLEARKEGKPFVFKLQSRIDEDLERIKKLRGYEETTGADLGKFVREAHLAGRAGPP
jgi:hypothetical protein